MKKKNRSLSLFSLIIPFSLSILVLCITAGYYIYRYASEKAYREKWKDYNDCGLA